MGRRERGSSEGVWADGRVFCNEGVGRRERGSSVVSLCRSGDLLGV